MKESDICFFGQTNFRNQNRRFGIRRADRAHHIYVIGKTGMGKSTLLENLIFSDIQVGAGVALLDPHGDLAERISPLAETLGRKVIYFDPTQPEHAMPFNILKDSVSEKHLIVSGIVGAFKKIWDDSWGPRLEHFLRFSLLGLTFFPDATLLHVPRILTDKSFRERVVCYISDPQVKAFFTDEFEKYSARFRSEAVSPILNKVGAFLANPVLRHILGQRDNSLRFREMMDAGGHSFIANLSKGKLGEDASALLGALLLSQIERAALSRADMPLEKRKNWYLYVDEFQNFATPSFVGMLSEARKYALSLTLANQFVSQLDESIRAAIFGNVGTLISFQVGVEDAEYLAKEFAPTFREVDLISLPKHHIYLKLMCDGKTCEPFSALTLGPPKTV